MQRRLTGALATCACCLLAACTAATTALAGPVAANPAGTGTGASAGGLDSPASVDFAARAPWLGLNGNSADPGEFLGALGAFVAHRIVYDRGNAIEWTAGRLPSEAPWREGLAASIGAGMVPVITIEFAGYHHGECTPGHDCLPTGSAVAAYVAGFVRSATAIRAAYPGRTILFEPINEPYIYGTAAQYADILAPLLPAAARAGIPLRDVYVAATGERWISDMYAAQNSLRTAIAGWYAHPYGPPVGSEYEYSAGIQSLPYLRAEMASGQDNIIVSEVGYCARAVPGGEECPDASYTAQTSAQAAAELTETLAAGAIYHEAGWLKALLVYDRGGYQGWGMQLSGGVLTAQGEALDAFADLFG